MNDLAIVVVAYNRVDEFRHTLNLLLEANISTCVDLIVAVDWSEAQSKITRIFDEVVWPHGKKILSAKSKNVGLKENVLSACDMGAEYDVFVVLEDDLEISRSFLTFSIAAAKFYSAYDVVAGISLYSYRIKESDKLPIFPVHGAYDTYFMRFPSSWGQVWTRNQWKLFRQWMNKNDGEESVNSLVPGFVQRWPKSSWKKYFVAYLCDTKKFFVYPVFSYTSNRGIDGANHKAIRGLFEVPVNHEVRDWAFCPANSVEYFYDQNFRLRSKRKIDKTSGFEVVSSSDVYHYFPWSSKMYFMLTLMALRNDLRKVGFKLREVFKVAK